MSEEKFAGGKEFTVSEVIDSFGINSHTWLMFVLLGLANIFDGYDFMVVNATNSYIAATFWPDAYASGTLNTIYSAALGSLTTWGLLGMVLGGATGGIMSDKIGRKRMLVIAVIFYGLFTLPQAFSTNVPFFAAFRLIAGFGVGSCIPIVTTCFSETIPSKNRAIFVTFGMAFMVAGWVLAGVICAPVASAADPIIPGLCDGAFAGDLYASNDYVSGVPGTVLLAKGATAVQNWRVCYLIGALPLIYGIILIFAMHETPHWFANAGRVEEACEALAGIEQRTTGSHKEYDPALLVVPPKPENTGPNMLFSNKFIVATAAIWCTYFVGQFTVYGMNAWIPSWFQAAGYSTQDSVNLQTWNNVAAILSNTTCGFGAEKFGRKKNLLGIWIICIVVIIICAIVIKQPDLVVQNGTAVVGTPITPFAVCVVLMLLFGYALNYAITCVQPLMPEGYPTALRNTGVAWCQAFARFGGSGSSIVLGSVAGAFTTSVTVVGGVTLTTEFQLVNWPVVVLTLIIPFVLGFVCTVLYVVETGGRSMDELAEVMAQSHDKDTGKSKFAVMMIVAAILFILCIVCPLAISGFSSLPAALPLMTIGMLLPFIYFFVFATPHIKEARAALE